MINEVFFILFLQNNTELLWKRSSFVFNTKALKRASLSETKWLRLLIPFWSAQKRRALTTVCSSSVWLVLFFDLYKHTIRTLHQVTSVMRSPCRLCMRLRDHSKMIMQPEKEGVNGLWKNYLDQIKSLYLKHQQQIWFTGWKRSWPYEVNSSYKLLFNKHDFSSVQRSPPYISFVEEQNVPLEWLKCQ